MGDIMYVLPEIITRHVGVVVRAASVLSQIERLWVQSLVWSLFFGTATSSGICVTKSRFSGENILGFVANPGISPMCDPGFFTKPGFLVTRKILQGDYPQKSVQYYPLVEFKSPEGHSFWMHYILQNYDQNFST